MTTMTRDVMCECVSFDEEKQNGYDEYDEKSGEEQNETQLNPTRLQPKKY